ncbi:MAG: acyl-CoA synthetase, partial [Lysobacterales bacterium]
MPSPEHKSIYDGGLDRAEANYQPLTPISYLERSASIYPDKTAVIHANTRFSYAEFYARCRMLASALSRRGIGRGDTVSVMASNVPALLETHYGVPMAGAVLNALNYRLDADNIAFILEHAQTRLLITDREFSDTIAAALAKMDQPPMVIDIDDAAFTGGKLLGEKDYEALLREGSVDDPYQCPADEWQAISLCYTSGTTGNPKGVVYHHRGAYLNALGQILAFGLSEHSIYLWTLPMFHCNGWTYTWAVTAAAGTHVCLRRMEPGVIFATIKEHHVTHMCSAPVVLNMLVHAPAGQRLAFDQTVEVATGGAAPPSRIISSMEELGFRVTHLYGLTETYGPAILCAWQSDWNDLDVDGRAAMMARQGVAYHTLKELMVADPESMQPVPPDGSTMGELMLRGNTVMKGYLKNPVATGDAFRGDWLHTGDLAVRHPNGYVEVKDRAKDIIISGGENISSLEVEELLYKHPAIMEAAVVARPDDFWGESVCAFVALKPDAGEVGGDDIISWCRDKIAKF